MIVECWLLPLVPCFRDQIIEISTKNKSSIIGETKILFCFVFFCFLLRCHYFYFNWFFLLSKTKVKNFRDFFMKSVQKEKFICIVFASETLQFNNMTYLIVCCHTLLWLLGERQKTLHWTLHSNVGWTGIYTRVMGGGWLWFFLNPSPPHQNRWPLGGAPQLKMKPPPHLKNNSFQWKVKPPRKWFLEKNK